MSKLTKQGVRDLSSISSADKKHQNGRRDKKQENCFHIFDNCIDDDFVAFRKCQRCGYEDI